MCKQGDNESLPSSGPRLFDVLISAFTLVLLYLLSMGPYFKITGEVQIPTFYWLADRLWLIRSPYNFYAQYMLLWGFTRA